MSTFRRRSSGTLGTARCHPMTMNIAPTQPPNPTHLSSSLLSPPTSYLPPPISSPLSDTSEVRFSSCSPSPQPSAFSDRLVPVVIARSHYPMSLGGPLPALARCYLWQGRLIDGGIAGRWCARGCVHGAVLGSATDAGCGWAWGGCASVELCFSTQVSQVSASKQDRRLR